MKISGVLLLAWLSAAFSASAQITVELVMERDQFVPGETIPLSVRMVNNSGQMIHFGDEDWLSFSIEGRGGEIVTKLGDPPVVHNLDLQASERLTQHVDLAPCYDLMKSGHYKVIGNINIKAWGAELTSTVKNFDVIKGTKVWEQPFGVPHDNATNNSLPEIRKYILEQATYTHSMRLYLRLTDDSEGRTIRVFTLGPMISFSNPQERIDRQSNLHVIYQTGARVYNYSTVNPEGEVIAHQTYAYDGAPPRLAEGKDGKIVVAGAFRQISPDDIPAKTAANDAPKPQVPSPDAQ